MVYVPTLSCPGVKLSRIGDKPTLTLGLRKQKHRPSTKATCCLSQVLCQVTMRGKEHFPCEQSTVRSCLVKRERPDTASKPVEGLGVSSSSHVLPVQSQQLVQVHGASIPMWKAGKPLRIKPGAGTWCVVGKCEMNPDGKELRPQLIAGSHQWN